MSSKFTWLHHVASRFILVPHLFFTLTPITAFALLVGIIALAEIRVQGIQPGSGKKKRKAIDDNMCQEMPKVKVLADMVDPLWGNSGHNKLSP